MNINDPSLEPLTKGDNSTFTLSRGAMLTVTVVMF